MCITRGLFIDLTVHSVLAGYFTFWVVPSLIWGLIATIIETLLTTWEPREAQSRPGPAAVVAVDRECAAEGFGRMCCSANHILCAFWISLAEADSIEQHAFCSGGSAEGAALPLVRLDTSQRRASQLLCMPSIRSLWLFP